MLSYDFHVLAGDILSQRDSWNALWEEWPDHEIFAHPDYINLFCQREERAVCAVWMSKDGGVLFPLIIRPLSMEKWAVGAGYVNDLTGPYGYGGPYRWGNVNPDTFWESFDSWAKKNRVVSLFTRLSLFKDQLLPFRGSVELIATNIVRTLDAPIEVLWARYEHKVRKNVNRAQKEGVVIERDDYGARIDDFLDVYYSTMRRRGAGQAYWFTKEFFLSIVSQLKNNYTFFYALKHDRVISAELILVSGRHLYSYLGGTLAEAYLLRPNDLLKHNIIRWGLELGKSGFVLGGGYSGTDGIFRYKRSFAPDGEVPFYVGKRVWDDKLYTSIVEMRRAFEINSGNLWEPNAKYFPLYRG